MAILSDTAICRYLTWASWGCLHLQVFPALGLSFSLSIQIHYHAVNSSRPFWKWARGLRGFLVVWSPPYWVCLWSTVHACSSTHSLCCALLQESIQGVCPRKMLPYLCLSSFSSHIQFFPTACSYQQSLVVSIVI